MDLITMESFVALCQYGNFTKAAEHMYISQSALSKRIAALEIELGLQLIERNNSGIILTLAGRELLSRCEKMLQMRYETEKRMGDFRQGIKSQLKIGFRNDTVQKLAARAVDAMSKKHPEIELMFSAVPTSVDFCDLIRRRKLDCVLSIREDFEHNNEITYRVYHHNKWGVLLSKSHPYANASLLKMEDLVREKLVLYTRDQLYSAHTIAKLMDSFGYDRREILYTDNRSSMMLYICTGRYVGLGAMDVGDIHESLDDVIKCVPLIDCNLRGGDKAIAYDHRNPEASTFAEILVDVNNEKNG